MGNSEEAAPGAPVEAYHVSVSGAPVGPDPMARVEQPVAGVVSLRAPGYRPVTLAPTPASAHRQAQRSEGGSARVVALVAVVVALAMVGAVLMGVLWR